VPSTKKCYPVTVTWSIPAKDFDITVKNHLFLIAFLALSSGPAYAEWVEVVRDDRIGMTLYVDPATIRRRGDVVEMEILYDYKTAQRAGGDSYLSRKVQNEYNCPQNVRRMLGVTEFSGNMASGKIVYNSSTLLTAKCTPVRTSVAETLLKVACGKQ
jgi:hypothetical protein